MRLLVERRLHLCVRRQRGRGSGVVYRNRGIQVDPNMYLGSQSPMNGTSVSHFQESAALLIGEVAKQ
jgi:hypothetical protein